jgi:hypothetical protein
MMTVLCKSSACSILASPITAVLLRMLNDHMCVVSLPYDVYHLHVQTYSSNTGEVVSSASGFDPLGYWQVTQDSC